jgi:hypothetical protein
VASSRTTTLVRPLRTMSLLTARHRAALCTCNPSAMPEVKRGGGEVGEEEAELA